jgi:hypothetical protein
MLVGKLFKKFCLFFTGDSGECDKRTALHHRKSVPGSIPPLEETLGIVSRQ